MDENVTTTVEVPQNDKWSIEKMYESEFSIQELVKTLEVVAVFRKKYPNDETVQDFENIVRDEICQMFGGNIDEIYGE